MSIAALDGIGPFVELVSRGTSVAKKHSDGVLCFLRNCDYNQVSIAAAGGIGPLVELVRSGTSTAKEKAAGAIGNLA
eukprot:4772092-Pleurochrysis_carterae.AAC.1